MDKKFKLLNTPQLEDRSSYWTCCPLKNQYLPSEECPEGKPLLDKSNKIQEEPGCPWWINSKKHNYCFWKFVKDNSNSQGEMPEMVQSDLAKLFGWSNTKAHFMLKEAMENLIEVLKIYDMDIELNDLSEELTINDLIKSISKNGADSY